MATRQAFIDKARSQIGVKESPMNSNKVKYNTWFYGKPTSAPWCMNFVDWCADQVGILDQIMKTASCGQQASYAQKTGRWHWSTKGIQAGDIVIFSFSSAHDHTGIVTSVGSSTISTIEGNTSASGSQDNGGIVMAKTRNKSKVYGYIRLSFEAETGNANIKKGQHEANLLVKKFQIAEDGIRGADTKKKGVMVLQTCLNKDYGSGLVVDGIVGANTKKALGSHYVEKGETQWMVTCAEILYYMRGENPNGVEKPGIYGTGLAKVAGNKITASQFLKLLE